MTDTSVTRTAAAASLSAEERLVLWGMRAWTAGRQAEVAVDGALLRAFGAFDAEGAVPTLDSAMELLNAAGVRAFHAPWCRCLGDEERLLLDILGLHQRGDEGAALFLTRVLLPPAGARVLGPALNALAGALLTCGVRLADGRVRPPPAASQALWAPSTMTLQ